MNESAVNQRGLAAIQPQLDAIAALKSVHDIAPMAAKVTLPFGRNAAFRRLALRRIRTIPSR